MFELKDPEHVARYRRTIDAILRNKELKQVCLKLDNSSMRIVLSDDWHNDKILIDGIRNILYSEDVMNHLLWEMTFSLKNGNIGYLVCDQVVDGMMVKFKRGDVPVWIFSVFLDLPKWAEGCVGYLYGDDYYKYDNNVEAAFQMFER